MKYAVSMPRAYVQVARAEGAAARRREVLDQAIEMLASEPLPRVTLDALARRAGVARSTVYVQFGSRSELFESVAERLLERVGFARLTAAVELTDPLHALRAAMVESVRLYAAERDVSRALWSWAELDPDAGRAFEVLDGGRADGTAHLVGRLADAGLLRDGVSRREASDVMYLLTSFDSFDTLYTARRLDEAAVTRRLTSLVESALLAS
jgi:AcrR family transcriptional regulator